jgi:uncharacterized protein
MMDRKQRTIWIGVIGTIALSLFCFAASAQSPGDLEQKARQLEQDLQGTTDMNKLMEAYRDAMQTMDDAMRRAGGVTGTQAMPIQPATTPEKEMERRREIINRQYQQAKGMMGGLQGGAQKPQVPEAFPLEGYIVVNGGEKELFSR